MHKKTSVQAGEIEALWRRFFSTRAVELRNKIVVHYSELVHANAARFSRRLSTRVSYDEICSAAFDGLISAVESYDPERKAKFEVYCQQRISGAVLDWLRSLDVQSRTVRTFEKKRMLAKESLYSDLEFGPSRADVARRLSISSERYDYLCRLSQLGKEVHFSAMEGIELNGKNDPSQVWDIRDERVDDPAIKVSREMLAMHLSKGLSREERVVLMLYYFEQITMAEIGTVMDLSESRVSQVHKSVLARLRHRFAHDTLELTEDSSAA